MIIIQITIELLFFHKYNDNQFIVKINNLYNYNLYKNLEKIKLKKALFVQLIHLLIKIILNIQERLRMENIFLFLEI